MKRAAAAQVTRSHRFSGKAASSADMAVFNNIRTLRCGVRTPQRRSSFRLKQTHPAIISTPPTGVTMPSQRAPVSASR